ncbi:DUF5681 domain-containing protein [Seohaeicola sp. 4SK31]|uniref:DUF5681 domain-containing protein n=1 Tax=Seohaeicola sp. 4SK31 TaxID=3028386 RepID=UPI003FD1D7AA
MAADGQMGTARAERATRERHHKAMGTNRGGRDMTRKSGRNTDGTFGPGNPGKPKGARHKATQAALALLDGEAEALTRQAVTMALGGDTTALRLCLERIAPPRKPAHIHCYRALHAQRNRAGACRTDATAIRRRASDGNEARTRRG